MENKNNKGKDSLFSYKKKNESPFMGSTEIQSPARSRERGYNRHRPAHLDGRGAHAVARASCAEGRANRRASRRANRRA
jgi:hypothetical protein